MTDLTPEQRKNFKAAKILIYDIEISPTLGWVYGQYDTNVLKVEKQPLLMSISWKWLGDEGEPQCMVISHKDAQNWNDIDLVMKMRQLFDEANLLVGHNIDRFDNRVMTGKFIDYGLKPPSPCKSWDTLKMARKHKFGSNKLGDLGDRFGEGTKTKITHADVWYDLLFGSAKDSKEASQLMKKYNIQDVALTEKIFSEWFGGQKLHFSISFGIKKPHFSNSSPHKTTKRTINKGCPVNEATF